MKIIGEVGEGKFGVMSDAQIKRWLMKKDSRIAEDAAGEPKGVSKELDNSYKQAISKLLTASDSLAAGGGNTKYTYDGLPLHHDSGGVGSTGVTIFYVKRDEHAKVVGLGTHSGAQTYDLVWKVGDWMKKVTTISLDKKLQSKGESQIGKQKTPKGGF